MENKNTIIALVLMAVVWFGFSFLFPQQETQAPAPQQAITGQPISEQSLAGEVTDIVSDHSELNFSQAREIEIKTDVYRAVFTTSGARLKTLALNHFRETPQPDAPQVLITDAQSLNETTLQSGGRDGWAIPSDALYQVDFSSTNLSLSGDETRSITFSWQDRQGLRVEKIYRFTGNRYDFQLQLKVTNQDEVSREGHLFLALIQPWSEGLEGSNFDFVGPMTLVGEKLHSDDVDDLAKEIKVYQDPVWTTFSNKYFMSAVIPQGVAGSKVTISKQDNLVVNRMETPMISLSPGDSTQFDYLAYLGPRDLDIVRQVGSRLEESIDFGFFTFLALPLRYVLNFFFSYVGNYGVAIILLTVIIKIIFWPLTQKSYTSMKSMQKLQPEMQRLREKYKNDKERLNKEMMQMYKEKRVNPLGGCLPMLVQIPVFFALYKTLMVDIGLRHAPFVFWLQDLSEKDPYYITPIIMGITMFIQQKMSPTTMDPTQAKIFMMMPVVFTFMFLNFPAGLVIYWLVNNLLTIFQQYLIHRKPA